MNSELVDFVRLPINGDLMTVPGIGPRAVARLASGEDPGDKVTNTFQLCGKFLMLRNSTADGGIISHREHYELFYTWLQSKGINANRSVIAKAILEKVYILCGVACEWTDLHSAAESCDLDAAKRLVASGCPVYSEDLYGNTAVSIAENIQVGEEEGFGPSETDRRNMVEFLTAAKLAAERKDYHSLKRLCGRHSHLLEKRFGFDLRYEILLCLLAAKKTQLGYDVAHNDNAGVTLLSRIYDREVGLARLTLSFVGPDQEAA
jgi:hypothetical protein